MSTDTLYFSHDYDARNDPKIIKLFRSMGFEGKGIYWDIIEILYQNSGYINLKDIEEHAFALRTDCERINKVLNEFDLFKNDGEKFWSESVLRRLDLRLEKSEKAKLSAKARWDKTQKHANALPTQYERNAIKESKGNEIKENSSDQLLKPVFSDVLKHFVENGYTETSAKVAFDYYENLSWHNKYGKPLNNWRLSISKVWFTPENLKPVASIPLEEKIKIDHSSMDLSKWQ